MRGQKSSCNFTLPINVKHGIMYTLSDMSSLHTLSKAYETRNCECRHQTKGTVKVWKFRYSVCRFEGHTATEIFTLPIHVELCTRFLTCQLSILCRKLMKLETVNVDTGPKVLLTDYARDLSTLIYLERRN